MDKHCKGCLYHHSAGRRNPPAELKKYNDWCTAKGASVDIGHCINKGLKKLKDSKHEH
jgi:hypothetical protein